jgi:hypothetical protein
MSWLWSTVLVYACLLSLARVYTSRCIGTWRLSFFRAGSRGVTWTAGSVWPGRLASARDARGLLPGRDIRTNTLRAGAWPRVGSHWSVHARRTRPASPGSPRRRHVHGSPATTRSASGSRPNQCPLASLASGRLWLWPASEVVVVVHGAGRYLGRFGIRNVGRIKTVPKKIHAFGTLDDDLLVVLVLRTGLCGPFVHPIATLLFFSCY